MPIIQVAGLTTNYEQIGSGPALILLHGWANSWEDWLPIIPYLSDHFTLIMPDLPGCGKSSTPKSGWSTAQHALWLQELLQQLSASSFQLSAICGHSYGGKILLEYCSGQYEPQPKQIVLMDASGLPTILNKKQKTLARLSALTPNFLKEKLSASMRAAIYGEFGADSDYIGANEFQKKTLQLVLSEDYTNRLATIAQKTLIIWGKNDASTPLWQAETMQQLIPLNMLVTYESGHFPHHQYPEAVSKEIIRFIE